MSRRFAFVLIWLALTAEVEGYVFERMWSTPLTAFGTLIFRGLFGIPIPPWDIAVIATMAVAMRTAGRDRVRPIEASVKISLAAVAFTALWGFVTGGSAHHMVWQLHSFVLGMCVALMVIAVCKRREHFVSLGKVVVFAAVYRAITLFFFYFLVAKDLVKPLPVLTDHADSVLFVSGIAIMWVRALEKRTVASIGQMLVVAAVLVVAIVLNNRRMAWLGLGATLFMTYVLFPKDRVKRFLTRALVAVSPLLVAYLVLGWGKSTGIFKPVGSISSMFGANQDVSSIMRDIENYNLLRTLKSNPLIGAGWGQEYIEEVQAYDIASIFPQYRYLPHNSLLGVLAFTGMLGFAGIWQVIPVACFLHAKVCKATRDPTCRSAALASLLVTILVVVQMWGDVGFSHPLVNVMLGLVIGLAGRVPVVAEVWPRPQPQSRGAM